MKKHGFTMIELTLVLGIAGLIFLMAFIALPNLWASERDADRRATVMEFISSLKTYQTNNSRGAMPVLSGNGPETFTFSQARASTTTGDWQAFVREYIDPDFGDPSDPEGYGVNFYIANCLGTSASSLSIGETCAYDTKLAAVNTGTVPSSGLDYTLYVAIGATCDGDHAVKAASARSIAAVYALERSGRYCYNN